MAANVLDAAIMHNAFQSLFTSLTAEQVNIFTEQIHAVPSPTAQPTNAAGTVEMESVYSPKDKASTGGSSGLQKAIRAKERQAQLQVKAKKRATNNFITFRAYYSALFRGLTQKARSGFIKEMWIEEPRKHFFTLIARAHCEVRDSYPGKLSFSRFLASTVELLPIVPVNLYMKAMGWELTTDTHGEPKLFRSNIPVDKSLNLTTNVSVGDIVEHCYKIGLVPRPAQALRPVRGQVLSMESAMAMSFAAAPNQNASSGNRKLVVGSETQQQVDPEILERMEAPVPSNSTANPTFDFNDLTIDYRPSMQVVIMDQQQAYDRYPFAVHFHPDAPAVLGFDPRMVQDEFDPFNFDLGDYVDFNL